MRIPILKLHNYLLISIQTEIDDQTADTISRGFIR